MHVSQNTLYTLNLYSYCLAAKLCPTLVTPWTVACQAPLSMRFSRQEYWSGLSFPSPCRQILYCLSHQGSPNLHTAVCQLYLNKTGRRKKGIQISRLKLGRVREYNGEGNGTPLQYSCLENPMDGGA